jgi:hypothetical protein
MHTSQLKKPQEASPPLLACTSRSILSLFRCNGKERKKKQIDHYSSHTRT